MSLREGNEDEEKRLFYVAITRPKQELVITYTNESQRGQGTAPSAFLDYNAERFKTCRKEYVMARKNA